MTTPVIKLKELTDGQASPHATVNEALRQLDGHKRVISRTTSAQPGSVTNGAAYIMPASPTGTDWAGFAQHDLVIGIGGAWLNYVPVEGWGPIWVNDEDVRVDFDGSTWAAATSGSSLVDYKDSVTVATTANITLSGEQTIDGVLTSTDRILVKDQTTASENGIYVTAAGAWSRATDFDTDAEVTAGCGVVVTEGTTNADKLYLLTTNDPITVGTTSLAFSAIGTGAGIADVVDDTTPQLGGMLDVNGQAIGDGTLELLKFVETASAVNEITVTNAATAGAPKLSATGDDTNIGIEIAAKGSGSVILTGPVEPSGTVDGRDLATDGSKLDGIEAGADVTDSTNVAAAGAVMDSDISAGEGFLRKTGAGTYEAIKSNLGASTAPTATDDSGSGYGVGSRWIDTTADKEYVCLDSTSTAAVWTETTASALTGKLVDASYSQDSALATGTTTMTYDDTIPQNTEGDQYLSVSHTPADTANLLKIEVIAHCAHSSTGALLGALFQDTTADAISAGHGSRDSAANAIGIISLTHWMVAGTTSATTFKFRAGSISAGTTTFNGNQGSRKGGGVMGSMISVTEYKP